jgi:hypothetical protein
MFSGDGLSFPCKIDFGISILPMASAARSFSSTAWFDRSSLTRWRQRMGEQNCQYHYFAGANQTRRSTRLGSARHRQALLQKAFFTDDKIKSD